MNPSRRRSIKARPAGRGLRLSKARLESLVEEATVDAYGDAEQTGGFFTMIEDNLRVPFSTEVLGVEVTVTKIDMTEADEIVAICGRGRESQRISILELPLPSPAPEGSEWIAAYRYWRRGGR
jgi:Calcium binding